MPLSTYNSFTRGEWARLRDNTPLTLSEADLMRLRGVECRAPEGYAEAVTILRVDAERNLTTIDEAGTVTVRKT